MLVPSPALQRRVLCPEGAAGESVAHQRAAFATVHHQTSCVLQSTHHPPLDIFFKQPFSLSFTIFDLDPFDFWSIETPDLYSSPPFKASRLRRNHARLRLQQLQPQCCSACTRSASAQGDKYRYYDCRMHIRQRSCGMFPCSVNDNLEVLTQAS